MLDLIQQAESIRDDEALDAEAAERATRRAAARVTRAFAVTVLILLVLGSHRLVTWVNGFDVGPVQDTVVSLSGKWDEQMEETGLDAPANDVRTGMDRLRSVSWAEVQTHFERERARTREGAKLLRGMISDTQG